MNMGRDTRALRRVYVPGMEKKSLGKHYIRQWRQMRGLSLRQLSERMEVEPGGDLLISHASLGRIEKGEQPYSQPILEGLSHALDVPVYFLLEVNPEKDGDVVDMLALLKRKDPETVRAFLNALPDKAASGQ